MQVVHKKCQVRARFKIAKVLHIIGISYYNVCQGHKTYIYIGI